MIANNISESKDDVDVLCNMVSVLPIKYDLVTEVTDVEKEYFSNKMA